MNAINHYTFTTPYRSDTNISKSDTNSNTNNAIKTSSYYKKYSSASSEY